MGTWNRHRVCLGRTPDGLPIAWEGNRSGQSPFKLLFELSARSLLGRVPTLPSVAAMSALNSATSTPGPLLLCVDLQPVFLNAVSAKDPFLRRCSFAIEAARGLGLPIVFTEQVPQKLGTTDASLLSLCEHPVQFGKSAFSALADHGIRDALLQTYSADHLLIIGLETPICIYQTAIDAIRSEIPVTLFSDCLAARRQDDACAALDSLKRAGANILPSETVFYSMLGDTHHPFFKTYTQLVKKYA